MIRLQYISSNGTAFNLLSWEGLKTQKADFHKYTWGKDVAKKQFGEIVNYFTKTAQSYSATFLFRGNLKTRKNRIEAFHFCTEYDITHQTPGRLYWGDDYIDCFIISSDTRPKDSGEVETENQVTIYCPYPFWIEEQLISITMSGGTGETRLTDKGYTATRYPYPYSYPTAPNSVYAYIDHYTESNFKMVVYGAADTVDINIAGNIYSVNHSLRNNQYMVIDSRPVTKPDKRCYIVSENGVETNVFDYRSPIYPLFKPIPGGDILITYSRGYGIDLTIYKERSEPRCLTSYS